MTMKADDPAVPEAPGTEALLNSILCSLSMMMNLGEMEPFKMSTCHGTRDNCLVPQPSEAWEHKGSQRSPTYPTAVQLGEGWQVLHW